MRTSAAARWAETWRIPIITRFFRDSLGGTNIIAAISNSIAPANDT